MAVVEVQVVELVEQVGERRQEEAMAVKLVVQEMVDIEDRLV